MSQKLLETPIDNLVALVKKNPRCSLKFLKERLNVPTETLEIWLTVLEHYNILKVSYKGFEASVECIEKEDEQSGNSTDVDNLKETFVLKAKERNLTYDDMRKIWPRFLKEYEKDILDEFERKAKKRGYEQKRIEMAWEKFRKELEVL